MYSVAVFFVVVALVVFGACCGVAGVIRVTSRRDTTHD